MESIWKSHTVLEKWLFTQDQLMNTPSRNHGIAPERELRYRQEAASLIYDIGQFLELSNGITNTAVVYMHRFYMFHSFAKFHRFSTACTSIFLAAKAGDDCRKFGDIYTACKRVFETNGISPEFIKDWRIDQENVFFNEDVMLQTLGFDIDVEHPHTHIIKCLKIIKADNNEDIRRSSYLLATQMTHLTMLCLQFKPSLIACLAIYTSLKWTNWHISTNTQGREWYSYVDPGASVPLMDDLVVKFLDIYRKSQSRMKKMFNVIIEKHAKKYKKISPEEYMIRRHPGSSGNPQSMPKAPLDIAVPKFAAKTNAPASMLGNYAVRQMNGTQVDDKSQAGHYRSDKLAYDMIREHNKREAKQMKQDMPNLI